jgi:hypothetical protein
MEFYIRWEGYDEQHDSWEPWSKTLRALPVVHKYLIEKGMKSFVPTEFRVMYPAAFPRSQPPGLVPVPALVVAEPRVLQDPTTAVVQSDRLKEVDQVLSDLPSNTDQNPVVPVQEPVRRSHRGVKRKVRFDV